MTTRLKGFTVVLSDEMREDDAQGIACAIERLRGVESVSPVEADPGDFIVESRTRSELYKKIMEIFKNSAGRS